MTNSKRADDYPELASWLGTGDSQPVMSERVWIYQRGEYLPGVPARDLTAEEYTQYQALIEANYAATGRRLYIPLVEMDAATADLKALLDSIGPKPRLTFGPKMEAPMKPSEVTAAEDDEDDGIPDFGRDSTERE